MDANTIYNSIAGSLSNTYFDIANTPSLQNLLENISNTFVSFPPDNLSTATGSAPSYSARAWCKTGDTTTLTVGKNISSVSEPSTSRKKFNFTVGPANTDYVAFCTAINPPDGSQLYGTIVEHTNSYCTFSFSDDSSTNAVANTMFIAFW